MKNILVVPIIKVRVEYIFNRVRDIFSNRKYRLILIAIQRIIVLKDLYSINTNIVGRKETILLLDKVDNIIALPTYIDLISTNLNKVSKNKKDKTKEDIIVATLVTLLRRLAKKKVLLTKLYNTLQLYSTIVNIYNKLSLLVLISKV